MSFLQPWLLLGLPLVALPIIIHLINQRRFQTVRWGAMMFLLTANRMARGYARIRQWLIMAFRMAAIAALVFAISRPMASGWLGLAAGGRPDTTIIVLDRSPSMQQTSTSGGDSKLLTGRRQLAETLKAIGSAHWVLIESTTQKPRELESPDALLTSPATEGTMPPPICPPCWKQPAIIFRPTKPAERTFGSAPIFAATTGIPKAAAGGLCGIRFWRCDRGFVSTCSRTQNRRRATFRFASPRCVARKRATPPNLSFRCGSFAKERMSIELRSPSISKSRGPAPN